MLASIFVSNGVDALRNPHSKVEKAEPLLKKLSSVMAVPCDAVQAVRLNAAVQVGAGALLSLGRLPRIAAAALAASLVPSTVAGHPFWDEPDPATRKQERKQFLKNVGLFGGLILALFDWEGTPSPGWRARRSARRAARGAARKIGRSKVLQMASGGHRAGGSS